MGLIGNFLRPQGGRKSVHLAFRLELRADSFLQAQRMRMNFEDKPDVVYRGLVAIVTGNVNYLFDK